MGIWIVSTLGYCEQCRCEHGCTNSCSSPCFRFFWCLPRTGIVRSYVNSVFDILRNHHSIFHSGCTILQYFSTFLPVLFILFFMISALMGMRWYLIMILTYISLMIRMLSILSCAYWPFCISSLEKYLMKSFAHFSVWSFCCCCIIVLYIFWVPVPYQMHDLQMDLPFHSLPFTLL